MNGSGMTRLDDHGQTSSLNPAELQALDLDNAPRHSTLIAGDPVAMQPAERPGDPVPAERPGDPVPSERPGDPVPAERPGDPVPAERPCDDDSLGDPVACQGRPR